jgi:pilus assembly protein CpaB
MIRRYQQFQTMVNPVLRNPAALPWALALVCGALAYWGATRLLDAEIQRTEQRYAERYAARDVLVAAKDLSAGSVLDASTLARRSMPARFVARNALGPDDLALASGARLAQPLLAGDPIRPAMFASATSGTLADRLPSGERALTIQVDDTRSQSGLIVPGDHIDLLMAVETLRDGERAVAVRTLLESVPVLATGRRADKVSVTGSADASSLASPPGYDTLTLRVTPENARRISIAEREGELLVTLRAPGDFDSAAASPAAEPASRNVRRAVAHVDGWIGGRGQGQLAYRWLTVQP